MNTLLYGSLTLSLLHALIPSHWLPVVTIGQAQHWSGRQILLVTTFVGLAHTLSTTGLGVLVSRAGGQLAGRYAVLAGQVVPLLLLALGLWYLLQHLRHRHVHDHFDMGAVRHPRSFGTVLFSLGLAMFLSPCLEINTYFLSAGALGWPAVGLVALVYNVVTLSGMLLMVTLGRRGLQRLNAAWVEHHENLITGLTLVGLALFNFFIEF